MSTWDAETAEWYAEEYGEYPTHRLATDANELAPDAVIVDVGCGIGAALRRAARRVPDGTLIGLDPSPRMVEIARVRAAQDPNGHRIELREAAAEHLPLEDDAADVIFAFDSIDHWQDPAAGLRELRSGGRLVVVKDGGLPGGARAEQALRAALGRAGLAVMHPQGLAEGDVTCTMWVCGVAPEGHAEPQDPAPGQAERRTK